MDSEVNFSHAARLVLLLLIMAIAPGCSQSKQPYIETFDARGDWSTGSDAYGEGSVSNGVYDLLITGTEPRWVSAGKQFDDGVYEVEATQIEGPLDNGYGMLFRADTDEGNFYLFKVSSDGYVWIGRYLDEIEDQAIIRDHWFQSAAVKTGLNQVNKLRVAAESGNLIFFVNDTEVGRVTDRSFAEGDVGLFAETLTSGDVRIHFDNLSVTPLQT
jgi:hypothetical protein